MESAFRRPVPDGLTLIETFGRRAGRFVHLADHLARLECTARALGIVRDGDAIDRALAEVTEDEARVRLTLDRAGRPAIEAQPLAPVPAVWTVAIHPDRLDPADPWLRVKTSERARYDRARAALPPGVDEWLFLNTAGEVCEGTITNVFLRREGGLVTPPLACGLLPGILRARLLADGAREAILRPEDLAVGELLVGNSLRGLLPARLAG